MRQFGSKLLRLIRLEFQLSGCSVFLGSSLYPLQGNFSLFIPLSRTICCLGGNSSEIQRFVAFSFVASSMGYTFFEPSSSSFPYSTSLQPRPSLLFHSFSYSSPKGYTFFEPSSSSSPFWAANPKGTMSYRAEGGNFRPSEQTSERANEQANVRQAPGVSVFLPRMKLYFPFLFQDVTVIPFTFPGCN